MAINLNTNPYYDDFDESKNYLKVLFKPGFAVQARELTQLQTSIQKQIARFGSHVFKDGSIVLGGSATHTDCSWVDVTATAELSINSATITGSVSGATGRVISTKMVDSTTYRIYFLPTSGLSFTQDDTITNSINASELPVTENTSWLGVAKVFSLVDSVFFVSGHFAFCEKQSLIISENEETINKIVGITVTESIVNSYTDQTLLDPAQGSYNYAAPGADRYAITLTLSSYAVNATVPDNFIELARFVNNELVNKVSTSSYAVLDDNMARRTYDESGDYTVKPFTAKIVDHIGGDENKFSIALSAGKAYVKGYEFETIATTYKDIDRASDTIYKSNVSAQASYGDFVIVTTPVGYVDYSTFPQVDLYAEGTKIGSARIEHIEFLTTGKYKLYLFNITVSAARFSESDITKIASDTAGWYADVDASSYPTGARLTLGQNRTRTVPIQQKFVSSMLNSSQQSEVEYESYITIEKNAGGSTTVAITISKGEFWSQDPADYVLTTSTGSVVNITSVTIVNSQSATIIAASAVSTCRVYAPIVFRNIAAKFKTKNTATVTKSISTDKISLEYSDALRINSIFAVNNTDPANVVKEDVTNLFDFNNGQTDELYDHAWIKLKAGATLKPLFSNLEIAFDYFTQSATDGFFTVDSYTNIDYADIPSFTSTGGVEYRLSDVMDFRPRRLNNSTAIEGSFLATPQSRVSFSYSAYLPRIDKLIVTKERQFDLIRGVASESPQIPADLFDAMTLYVLSVPAYTFKPEDIKLQFVEHRRYTMRDIGKIDQRVKNIEYYTALSMLEKQAADEKVFDDIGVERFKNGILVDSFTGHGVGDVFNSEYLCSINKTARTLRPRFSSNSFNYVVSSLGGAQQIGDLITVAESSAEVFADQPFATGFINLNPFQVFQWNGVMELTPATDTWVDTQTKPDVLVNMNGENDIYTTLVNNVNNPASSGVVWNDWQTVVKGVSVAQNLTNDISTSITVVDGKTLETTSSSVSSSLTTTTNTGSFRTGLEINKSATNVVTKDIGSKVTDVSIVPYIRSRPIVFAAKNLKPRTELVAIFDNANVSEYCTPAFRIQFDETATVPVNANRIVSGAVSAQIVLARKDSVWAIYESGVSDVFADGASITFFNDQANLGYTTAANAITYPSELVTDAVGDIAGTFLIPNSSQVKFTVGEKIFRLADAFDQSATTAAETKYVASGLSQSVERTLVSTRVASVSVNPVSENSKVVENKTTSTVTATDKSVIDITVIPDPIRIICSNVDDISTGDFSNNKGGTFEYDLSYDDSKNLALSGTQGTNALVAATSTELIGVKAGMRVSGAGIPAGATVVAYTAGSTSFTISANLTSTISAPAGSTNVLVENINPWIGIFFQKTQKPVRYTLHYEGKQYTTGFVGSASFDSQLVARGLPKVVGDGEGKLFLRRPNVAKSIARLVVESPFDATDWQFSVPYPRATDPAVASPKITYAVNANTSRVSEGETVVFDIVTTNVPDSTPLYWTINGVAAADFTDDTSSGTVNLSNGRARITKTIKADTTTEGSETFFLELRTGSTTGTIVASSWTVTILDTSLSPPVYSITADRFIVNENGSVNFSVSTQHVTDGTVLYWTTNTVAGTVNSSDFKDGVTSGSVTISNGSATITRAISADATTEGNEEFSISLRTASVSGTVVATSQNVTIADTSLSAPIYSVSTTANSVGEGSSVTFTAGTKFVAPGTTLYWTVLGVSGTVNGSDLSPFSGSFTVGSSGSASITIAATSDFSSEGVESFAVQIRTGSTSGTVVATSNTVQIIDLSPNPSYTVAVNVSSVKEGGSVLFTLFGRDNPSNLPVYYRLLKNGGSNADASDFVTATSGSLGTLSAGSATRGITVQVSADYAREGDEFFYLSARTGSADGTEIARSPSVTVTDTTAPINRWVECVTVRDTAVLPRASRTITYKIVSTWQTKSDSTDVRYTPSIVSTSIPAWLNVTVTPATTPGPLARNTAFTWNVTVSEKSGIGLSSKREPNYKFDVIWTYASGSPETVGSRFQTLVHNHVTKVSLAPPPPPRIDPVAQTFFVDARTYPSGLFVSSLDLYFKKKSSDVPVTIQLRPTENGYPSSLKIIPFGISTKQPSEINVSSNGTVATNFAFENRVYLAPGYYSFVVLANTDEYEIFTSTLGEFTIDDPTVRVTKQPTLGSLFASQNTLTWTAVQEDDVKFKLYKSVFNTETSYPVTLNTNKNILGNIPYELFFTDGEVLDFADTDISYEFNAGDGWKTYQLGSNVDLGAEKTLTSNTSLQFRTTLKTTNRDISPVIDLSRLSNVLVHNIINNDSTDETEPAGGKAVARYVTRKVTLSSGFEASDLKVLLYANKPSGTDVKVYYKVATLSDVSFEDNNYIEMEIESAGSSTDSNFAEYKYKTPYTKDGYQVTLESGERFSSFAIKIVMLSNTSAKVPQIRDLRAIAFDD